MAILPLPSLPAAGLPASPTPRAGGGLPPLAAGPHQAVPHPQLSTRAAATGGGSIAPRMALVRLRATPPAAASTDPASEAGAVQTVRRQIATGEIILHTPHREANLDNALAVAVRGLAALRRDLAGR